MSVIQSIRDRYAKWAVVAIALALLGFILMDAFSGRGSFFQGNRSTTIGMINGKKIDYTDFQKKIAVQEQQMQAQGRQLGDMDRQRLNEDVWNQEINLAIMGAEYDKLGFKIGEKELYDMVYINTPENIKQQEGFKDPATGQFDPRRLQQQIESIKRSKDPKRNEDLTLFLNSLMENRLNEKYSSLLSSSVYFPKWYIEKQNTESSSLANISFVLYPYIKVADSTIKISDKEILEYINKDKERFKQPESRSIAYVVFDAAPTAADSALLADQMKGLKQEFAAATDPAVFLARYGSAIQYLDGYSGKSQIQIPAKDSVLTLEKNKLYGPYLDGGSYTIAKMIDIKTLPDSVRARHILIQTANPQNGQQLLDDSTAKKRIDSIDVAIRGGARFDTLAKKYSDDKGSGERGGLLSNPQNPQTDYYTNGQMVKEFNDFSFEGKKGEKKIVKTIFGYHLIEILDQKNFQPHYKIAYFSKPIVASDETDQKANNEANSFAGSSRDLKSFDANAEKTLKPKGIQKLLAGNIKPNDYIIEGLAAFGTSRQLVKEIYSAGKGDVLQPQLIGDKYIVAAVTEVYEEGTQSAATARFTAEPQLRNKKKAEQIKKMFGKITTLEAALAVAKDSAISITTLDSLRFDGAGRLFETKVLGAAFNIANKGKVISEPLDGQSGVYVVKVNDLSATAVPGANIEEQRKQMQAMARSQMMQAVMMGRGPAPSAVLQKGAKIKDRRSNFY
jgi:peptidyl-prolyl cis-trans isomerase D